MQIVKVCFLFLQIKNVKTKVSKMLFYVDNHTTIDMIGIFDSSVSFRTSLHFLHRLSINY